ncbi:hypothetical protein V8C44DRAFT_314341 [Trichoderma aethiopicum]
MLPHGKVIRDGDKLSAPSRYLVVAISRVSLRLQRNNLHMHCLGILWRRILSPALSLRSMINSALRRRWEGRCSLSDSTLTRQIPLPLFEGED